MPRCRDYHRLQIFDLTRFPSILPQIRNNNNYKMILSSKVFSFPIIEGLGKI